MPSRKGTTRPVVGRRVRIENTESAVVKLTIFTPVIIEVEPSDIQELLAKLFLADLANPTADH